MKNSDLSAERNLVFRRVRILSNDGLVGQFYPMNCKTQKQKIKQKMGVRKTTSQ